MLIMGIASFLIGLVPGSVDDRRRGPRSSWSLLRVAQGIAVGGEWGGAALMALEHADSSKRGFAASFVNAGAPSGALLGSLMMGLFALLPQEQFFAGAGGSRSCSPAVLLAIGMYVRYPGHRVPGVPEACDGRGGEGRADRSRCRCGRCCAARRR